MPTLDKELFLAEHSDLEEGGLDLTVALKPVSFYISDKKEMLQQCFCIIGEKKLQKMLPDVLKVLYNIYDHTIHIHRNIQKPSLQSFYLVEVIIGYFQLKQATSKRYKEKGFWRTIHGLVYLKIFQEEMGQFIVFR